MAELVYILCAIASTGCAALLLRNYARTRTKLLLWSSLCFVGMALNNMLLYVDLALVRELDFVMLRAVIALAAVCLLLFGLIWEAR